MSQFDAYTQAAHLQGLCRFLGKQHPAVLRFNSLKPTGRTGRLPKWSQDVVDMLERAVNAKAERCEATDSTISERIMLARQYRGLNGAQLARYIGMSREAVRLWSTGDTEPRDWAQLATVLNVPQAWLQFGGKQYLPANTHLGVRVGIDSLNAREQLYGLTLAALAEMGDTIEDTSLMAHLERKVIECNEMADLARRAGGRWNVNCGKLAFVPWVPIAPHGLARRYWSDEVEAIIQEALANRRSVYSAWQEVRRDCEAKGLEFPTLNALQKRVAKENERHQRYGIALDFAIQRTAGIATR